MRYQTAADMLAELSRAASRHRHPHRRDAGGGHGVDLGGAGGRRDRRHGGRTGAGDRKSGSGRFRWARLPRSSWRLWPRAGTSVSAPPATSALTERDTLVVADFTNTTDDPVFDDALKQAVAVQLQQTPFVTLLADQRVQRTLRLM